MAAVMYEVPTADADILLDLHHRIHTPSYTTVSTTTSAVRGGDHNHHTMDHHQAYTHQQQPYTYGGEASSSSSGRGHGHSLSLGQMPSYPAYDHVQQQHHSQHQQQYNQQHSRSYSASASTSTHSPYYNNDLATAPPTSSNGGDSNPNSRLQTISPLMGNHALPSSTGSNSNNTSNLGQSLHYSQGLGLAGIPIPPLSPGGGSSHQHQQASSSSTSNNPIYAPMPSYMQQQQQHHHQSMQYGHHLHGDITPPSPSDGSHHHLPSSVRHSHSHSLSDTSSFPYTPQSYTTTNTSTGGASSLPSSYHPSSTIGSNNKYDPHSLPAIISHHHNAPSSQQQQQQLQQQSSYESSYPLATSDQGFMTIYSASPTYGCKDSQINLEVGVAPHDPHYIRGFRVLFGSHGTTTRVVGESRADGEERVELVAVVPPIHLTNRIPANGSTCQLSLQALDEAGQVADWAELGVFEFTDISPIRGNKRPGSPLASLRDSPSSAMRPIFPDQSPYSTVGSNISSPHKRGHSRGSSIGSLVNGFNYMSHSRNSSMTSNLASEYDSSPHQYLPHHTSPQSIHQSLASSLPDKNGYHSAPPPPHGTGIVAPGSLGNPTVWYSTPDGELIERKPIARLRAPVQPPSSTPASSNLRHPPMEPATASTPTLYRTSQLPSTSADGSSNVATRAVLKFDGDLNNMALGWSQDEWHAKRRLVHFTRKQDGGTINATFKPIELQQITPNTIVISCIFREDKNECYVTSVDTIYLLEALVSVRFTVEEKNRIRRNLEGYKPLTITKAKTDCEDFFKVVMGFPNPKPRNIEKDVKVFPWKILSNALKKIISKYSASFLRPEEMVGPGKVPPQPIGWPPGRSPPLSLSSSNSISATLQDSVNSNQGGGQKTSPTFRQANVFSSQQQQQPPGTGSSSSSITMSPSMRNDFKPFANSMPSSSLGNGQHQPTLGSVAEDEPMPMQSAGLAPGQQQHTSEEIDELATPNANYDSGAVERDTNPFRFG